MEGMILLFMEGSLKRYLHLQKNVDDVMEVENVKTVEEVGKFMTMVQQVSVLRVNILIAVVSVTEEENVVLAMEKAMFNHIK